MLTFSTVLSHCFFIAYKDMMKGNEKKNESPRFFFSLAAKFFDETMMIV